MAKHIQVVQFDSDYIPNPNPKGETPFDEFWEVRLALLATSRKHGDTGPESRRNDPTYWLVDDQYNHELYQCMQVYEPEGWTVAWLSDLIETIRQFKGWAIDIGHIDQGRLVVFADRLMVSGPTFANCRDLESVVQAAKQALQDFEQRKTAPLRRQLAYISSFLPSAMQEADARTFTHLATFDRYELEEGYYVWILQTKRDNELILDTEYAPSRTSAVTADGTIHPEYCRDFWPYKRVSPPYWLVIYPMQDLQQSLFLMVDEDGNQRGSVTLGEVISDEQLKARYGA